MAESRQSYLLLQLSCLVEKHRDVVTFDATQEDWSDYAKLLGHYFIANDKIGEEKRRAVGPPTYCLLKTLALPSSLMDLSFEDMGKSSLQPEALAYH